MNWCVHDFMICPLLDILTKYCHSITEDTICQGIGVITHRSIVHLCHWSLARISFRILVAYGCLFFLPRTIATLRSLVPVAVCAFLYTSNYLNLLGEKKTRFNIGLKLPSTVQFLLFWYFLGNSFGIPETLNLMICLHFSITISCSKNLDSWQNTI